MYRSVGIFLISLEAGCTSGQELQQLTALRATRSSSVVSLGRSSVVWGWLSGRVICSDIHRKVPVDGLSYWGRKLDRGCLCLFVVFGDFQQI